MTKNQIDNQSRQEKPKGLLIGGDVIKSESE